MEILPHHLPGNPTVDINITSYSTY